jgi:hypothetical protein
VNANLTPRSEFSNFRARRRLVRLFIAGMLVLHAVFFASLRQHIEQGYPDFTVFYTGGTILREGLGRQLYDHQVQYRVQSEFTGKIDSRNGPLPYLHPPFEALIFLPLTVLPYREAFLAWDLLNVCALMGVALVLRRSVEALRQIPAWEFSLGALAFFPIFANFLQGQDSILLLLVCTLGFSALRRRADFLAGCWFGLGAFKFQLVIPLVLLVVIWRRKWAGSGFLSVSALLALLSAGLVGWAQVLRYPLFVMQVVQAASLGGVPPELMPNLRGLLLGWSFPYLGAVGIPLVVVGTAALFLFASSIRKGSGGSQDQIELRFSQAIVTAVLIGWHTNTHDLSLLVLPIVLVANYCRSSHVPVSRKRALLIPVLPLLVSPLWIELWLESSKVNLMAIPMLWWIWEIRKELSRDGELPVADTLSPRGALQVT